MSEAQPNTLLAPRFLFRFAVPLLHHAAEWKASGVELPESCRLPNLAELDAGSFEREPHFAEVRAAWSIHGLIFNVFVAGKKQPVWCREGRLEDSDGLQVWIDTRATFNIHRASRYCHRYAFLPAGAAPNATAPVADQLLINRARENARPIRPRELQVAAKVNKSGYALSAFVPAVALGGFDPHQYRQIGFTYAVYDRELGLQTFATGAGFPFQEDPTCWAACDLVEA
ncbi:MAG: hypothetical protein IT425_11310 [Pirellulales bacterium]|nr:hypothetical protein [Pirellulales bacterium]